MARLTRSMFVIAVPDLRRSAEWYARVLGFTVREIGDPGWRIFERDAVRIMAGECADATPARELGDHSYFAYLEVDGIDEYFAQVEAAGGRPSKRLRDEPWGMREFAITTIDGHRLTVGSPIGDPLREAQGSSPEGGERGSLDQ
jgi:predicted enzyme related to lactoylglutathione lyase